MYAADGASRVPKVGGAIFDYILNWNSEIEIDGLSAGDVPLVGDKITWVRVYPWIEFAGAPAGTKLYFEETFGTLTVPTAIPLAGGTLAQEDALFALAFLILGGPAPICPDAADANDDGNMDITDSISALQYLFLGGAAPALPVPDSAGRIRRATSSDSAAISAGSLPGEPSIFV